MQGGRHLLSLVDDILDITQMRGGRVDLALADVGTDELLADCMEQTMPWRSAKTYMHHQPGAAPEVLVRTDPSRLSQAVTNLLSNAITFNRPGGHVYVTYQMSDTVGNLDIVVKDTGLGIAIQDLRRLFVPFDRLDAGAKHTEGTGLGLTVARYLMTTMGGTLTATSQEGIGSIFIAFIPLARQG